MNEYYTYAYLREDGTPYYIGKGKGYRIYSKSKTEINIPKDRKRIIYLKKNLTEDEAYKHEIYMIFVFGRKDLETGILRNRTDGGNNPHFFKGITHFTIDGVKYIPKIKLKGDNRTENQKMAAIKHKKVMKGILPPNSKSVTIFGKTYRTIKQACKDNGMAYSQYIFLINSDINFNSPEELKKHIWEERNKKLSIACLGNTRGLGKKRQRKKKK